jgi:hypothetical protein
VDTGLFMVGPGETARLLLSRTDPSGDRHSTVRLTFFDADGDPLASVPGALAPGGSLVFNLPAVRSARLVRGRAEVSDPDGAPDDHVLTAGVADGPAGRTKADPCFVRGQLGKAGHPPDPSAPVLDTLNSGLVALTAGEIAVFHVARVGGTQAATVQLRFLGLAGNTVLSTPPIALAPGHSASLPLVAPSGVTFVRAVADVVEPEGDEELQVGTVEVHDVDILTTPTRFICSADPLDKNPPIN